MTAENDFIEDAEKFVEENSFERALEAFNRLRDKTHNKGCGCKQCIFGAVADANGWVDWYMLGSENEDNYMAAVVFEKGIPRILLGKELKFIMDKK